MTDPVEPIHVRDNVALADLAERWRDAPLLALDTEFVRETTFYPIAGLLQLGDTEQQYLIDPLAIDDWAPLRDLFAGGAPKVLHSPSEDLELFHRLLGTAPQPLFDTQVGAALAGMGFSLSYQALVQACLGIEVGKDQTRSDWLQRPLSAAQCHYAALDVAYLPAVFTQLAERLTQLGRFDWWREDGERVIAASSVQAKPSQYYLKLGAAWRLRGPQLAVLQALCNWRESEARTRNVPRGRIVKDPQCIEIARCMPRTPGELASCAELHPSQVRHDGAALLEIVERASALPADQHPPAPEAPLPREEADRLKQLRDLVTARAVDLGLAPEVLARKRDCELLLRDGVLPDSLKGWREAEIGAPLLSLLKTMG